MDMEEVDGEFTCAHEQAEEQGIREGVLYLLCPCGEEIARPLVAPAPTTLLEAHTSPSPHGRLEVRVTITVPLGKPWEDFTDEDVEALLDDICQDALLFRPQGSEANASGLEPRP